MNIENEIIQFTKEVLAIKELDDFDNFIDEALEPIKDYTDTIGDLISPIKPLIAIFNLKRKITLKSFIKNYSKQFYQNYKIDNEETKRLQKYLSNEKNVNLISEIIDSALNSKCLKATSILGMIAGKLIQEKGEIDYEYFSIIDTLKIMTDFDIENFIVLYEYLPTIGTSHANTNEYRTTDFFKNSNTNKIELNKEALELTIEKLKRTNGLTYSSGGIGQAGNSKGAFEINNITHELYRLLKNINSN